MIPPMPPTGMRHKPVMGSISCQAPFVHQRPPNRVQQVRHVLDMQPEALQLFRAELQQSMQAPGSQGPCISPVESMPIKKQIQQAWDLVARQYTVAKRAPAGHSTSGQTTTTSQIMTLWKLRSHIRKPVEHQVNTFLQRRLITQHAKLSRALHKRCRQRKRAKFEKLLEDATVAGSKGLTHLYRVVQQVAPKQRHKKLQLRDAHGLPQTGAQELDCLIRFYQDLYCDPGTSQAMQPRSGEFSCFTVDEVQEALQALPARKALPRNFEPAILSKTSADIIALAIARTLQDGLQTYAQAPCLDEEWHQASMYLMPKPGKPLKSAADLRPIALLSPFAKILARMAAKRLKPYVQAAVKHLPLFAYIEGRQAGRRCPGPCHVTLCQCEEPDQDFVQPVCTQKPIPTCGGGIQLSLHPTRAYDRVPWDRLVQALRTAQVSDELINLIFYIHSEAQRPFQHGNGTGTVHLSRVLWFDQQWPTQ